MYQFFIGLIKTPTAIFVLVPHNVASKNLPLLVFVPNKLILTILVTKPEKNEDLLFNTLHSNDTEVRAPLDSYPENYLHGDISS